MNVTPYSTTSLLLAIFLLCTIPSSWIQAKPVADTFSHTTPATYTIRAIEVTGNQSLEAEAVVAVSGLQVGDTIQLPGSNTQKAIQRLWEQDFIQDVSIYATHTKERYVTLTIAIVESPRLADYTFVGIDGKEQKRLLKQVKLEKEHIITDTLLQYTRRALLKYLREQGYHNAVVTLATKPVHERENYVHLTITVKKGKKCFINAIHIHGNCNISSDMLKTKMQYTREKARLSLFKDIFSRILTLSPIRKGGVLWHPLTLEGVSNYISKHIILSSSKLDKVKFSEDKKSLITFYQSRGFRDAKIVSESVKPIRDGLLDIHLTIEEGIKYYIRSIRWVGNKRHSVDRLSKVLALQPGDVYNPLLIQQRLNSNPMGKDVAGIYADDGHLFFRASPVEVGITGNTVDLEIRVQEGPQTYINKIIIEGNTMTHDHVIRRELRTLP
ncbi:MAG: POTRA domain-containing protein, partial [Bacteroidota bacterium]